MLYKRKMSEGKKKMPKLKTLTTKNTLS